MEDREARQRVAAVEASLERVDSLPEASRDTAHEAITGILELYGEALRRLVAEARRSQECSSMVRFARTDELVSHLLLLHGLHPDGEEPLEKLYAEEHGLPASEGDSSRGLAPEPELVTLGSRRRTGAGDGGRFPRPPGVGSNLDGHP